MEKLDMIKKLEELQELKRLEEELKAEIEALQDAVKSEMGDTETAVYGPFKVTYKTVIQNRLDSAALKKELPEVAARYSKQVTTRPLKVS